MPGLDVCLYHGGNIPAAREKSLKARAVQSAMALVNTYGAPVDVSPEEALLDEISRTNGHVLWLQEQILTSTPEELAGRYWLFRRSTDSTITWTDEMREVAAHSYVGVWMDLYLKERAHLAKLSVAAVGAGIEARKVALAERAADQVGRAIEGMLQKLGLDVTDPKVRAAAYQALMDATGGDTRGELTAGR